MPTAYTKTVSKIIYVGLLRKNHLQQATNDIPLSWEYVPVLEYIRHNPGCMQNDIAKRLNVSAAAVTQSTQKIERLGMLEKRINPENLRQKNLYITELGEEMLETGRKIFDETDNIMFRNFTDEEIIQLNNLLDKIKLNIENASENNKYNEKHLPWEF